MTVQELIDDLQKVENKLLDVKYTVGSEFEHGYEDVDFVEVYKDGDEHFIKLL